ncbi:MAG TPA: glycerophosphodiester phosphodiesterase family protein [Ktedonobacteraceae bacterium]|nr:glycerophosphodiester phosphodiesterase family protein [Ktedonobacteraceae bacterium]
MPTGQNGEHATVSSHPHPDSFFQTASGHKVQLKVHRCLWSGDYPENSLAALEECLRAPVARTEIDLHMLHDSDFLIVHDASALSNSGDIGSIRDMTRQEVSGLRLLHRGEVSSHQPMLFSEAADTMAHIPSPTLVELDMKDLQPLPWPRVEELARLAQPVKDRVIFSATDWNLRRLLTVDSSLLVGFNPAAYLDWLPEDCDARLPRGAYGYLDRHPLAWWRLTSVDDYLSDRLGGILRLVSGLREAHLRLDAFEQMLADGVAHAAELFHREGVELDVWTLDAGTPQWHERLARVVAAGVDMITTNTAREIAEAGRAL